MKSREFKNYTNYYSKSSMRARACVCVCVFHVGGILHNILKVCEKIMFC